MALLGGLLTLFSLQALGARDIKRADEVFRYSATASAGAIELVWDIEPGHYLYRDKMRFKAPGAELGAPVYPAGEVHADEFFGEQIIFRGRTVVRIPYTLTDANLQTLSLELRSQGCADWGLCYPPQRWQADIALPANAGEANSGLPFGSGGSGAALLGLDDSLPPEQAFRPSVSVEDAFTLAVRWDIAPGYYLYRKDFAVEAPGRSIQPGPLQLPAGVMELDPEFGETEVYYDSVTLRVPFTRASPDPIDVELQLAYQGCKQGSICYPPATVSQRISLPRAAATDVPPPVSEQDRLFGVIADASLPSVMFIFLGLGLLLAFTPCVLPMVPILSGIIAGQGDDVTTARSFWLSLSYVLGMAFTYTVAGAAVGAAGGQIQAALQTPLVLGFVAALFVGMSLAMFGLYELQLPSSWQTRLSNVGGQKSGGFFGTAVMGAISALVVSTCVAPPLVAALAVIAQTGDIARGAFALFSLSMGMGIPLLIFGTSAGKLLPKAGAWMNTVKGIFGLLLLGLAIWILDRVLPGTISMLLWAALAVFAGAWLGAFSGLGDNPRPGQLFGKGAGLLLSVYGAVLLVGALSGSTNPLQPLDRLAGGDPAAEHGLAFEVVKTVDDFEQARRAAAADGKTLMLDFYADWCVSCKEMEAWTFTDEAVQDALADTVLVQADVTANDEADQALLEHFGIFGPPTIVFYDRAGNEVQGQRVVGYMKTADFLQHLGYVLR